MLVCEHRSHKRMSGCHAALTESDRSVRKLSSLMEVISAFPHARDVFSYGPAAVAVSSSPCVVTHLLAKPTHAQAHMDVPPWRSWTICAV